MEVALILSASTWQLASPLERTATHGGVQIVKNIPAQTYLTVTPKQWEVLTRFNVPRTVPQVLEGIIDDRLCPALGEFFELILKAVRARILVAPGEVIEAVPVVHWTPTLKPASLRASLWVLFSAGTAITVGLQPDLPGTFWDYLASLVALMLAGAAGAALAATLLRGAGGEIYGGARPWLICLSDVCMLSPSEQRTVWLAPLAVLASTTGLLAWLRPAWCLLPLVGLLILLRPILGGRINRMIRVGDDFRQSDAKHAYLFPPNRTPGVRWRMLRAGLRSSSTWLEIGYGSLWTLVLGYFVGVMTDVPPWTLAFWATQGPRLAWAVIGSLILLGVIYGCSEFYLFAQERGRAGVATLRQGWRRWFGRNAQVMDEAGRLRAVRRSPLLRQLSPPVQHALVQALKPRRAGPWKILHDFDVPITHVSMIISGQVGVYRQLPSGRRILMQVLGEDDLVGLHAVADPAHPRFLYRTLTPVLLLQLDWAQATELVVARIRLPALAAQVQKFPFLARSRLCQTWHVQAIQRFAELAQVVDYAPDGMILPYGFYSENFFIMFEGTARVLLQGRVQGGMRSGDFFGEIGLLQNSNATAGVRADGGTRCLCIRRREFLRFVSHNYTVALELERVGTERLGHPIFPLIPGNFRMN